MVAVFGTMAADGLHVELGVPYIGSTIFYAIILAVVFYLWRRSEGTLSIHSIVTRRRETYYWLTVLATFALGTATGDLTATTLHLGFLASGIMFTGPHPGPGAGLVAVRPERDRRVLVGLRADPAARRLVRRLAQQAARPVRPELRRRPGRRRWPPSSSPPWSPTSRSRVTTSSPADGRPGPGAGPRHRGRVDLTPACRSWPRPAGPRSGQGRPGRTPCRVVQTRCPGDPAGQRSSKPTGGRNVAADFAASRPGGRRAGTVTAARRGGHR